MSHVVVADEVSPEAVPATHPRVLVVKQQWFWESIQIEASADEGLYPAKVRQPTDQLTLLILSIV